MFFRLFRAPSSTRSVTGVALSLPDSVAVPLAPGLVELLPAARFLTVIVRAEASVATTEACSLVLSMLLWLFVRLVSWGVVGCEDWAAARPALIRMRASVYFMKPPWRSSDGQSDEVGECRWPRGGAKQEPGRRRPGGPGAPSPPARL